MRAPIVVAVTLMALAGSTARAQRTSSVLGSRLEVDLHSGPRLTAELLAVQRDSLWLLPASGQVRIVPLADVRRARVRRGGLNAGGVMAWTLIGGLVTGGALTAACSSVEDTACGGVLPATLLSWVIVGGISAGISGSGWRPVDSRALVRHARFPQGLPEEFGRRP